MFCEQEIKNSTGTIEIPEPPELKNKDKNRDYKLRYVAKFNDLDNVKYQLKHGANVNSQDNNGKTALHEASIMGWTDIIETLINAGANVNLKDNEGKIPLPLFSSVLLHNAKEFSLHCL
jgi:ankyrin repeat protein